MQISFCDRTTKYDLIRKRGLYKIINTVNGHWYVGSTNSCVFKRFLTHRLLLRKNKHPNPHLQNAYNKYGESNFVFLVIETSTDKKFTDKEQEIINKHLGKLYCYNISKDTLAPMSGRKHTKETLEKMSVASKKRSKEIGECTRLRQLGTKHRPETIEKMKTSAKNRDDSNRIEVLKSKEVREKISKSLSGRKMSPERYEKILVILKSEEYRKKMSQVKKGIPASNKMKHNASLSRLGKQITFIKDGFPEIALSIRNFCEKYGLDRHEIRKVLREEIEEYKGWRLA